MWVFLLLWTMDRDKNGQNGRDGQEWTEVEWTRDKQFDREVVKKSVVVDQFALRFLYSA
jgi:hypothetical protein